MFQLVREYSSNIITATHPYGGKLESDDVAIGRASIATVFEFLKFKYLPYFLLCIYARIRINLLTNN